MKTKRESSYIQTVNGRMESSMLGFCQCHEHLFIEKGMSYQINHALFMTSVEKGLQEVFRYQDAGGAALVDAQPVGCGRMAEELLAIGEKTNAQIIASTGFHKLIFYKKGHWIFEKDKDWLEDLFISELTKGMVQDADQEEPKHFIRAKAGIIKTALDYCGLTPDYMRLFLAAASAQRHTGRAMMIHVEKGADPLALYSFLQAEGVAAEKIIFCHMDRACQDLNTHKKLCEAGCYMEYDTIGRFRYHSDETEAALIKEMIDAGYEERLLFSLDTTRTRLRAYTPDGVGLDYILRIFLGVLQKAGVSESHIKKLSIDNPRRVLSFTP